MNMLMIEQYRVGGKSMKLKALEFFFFPKLDSVIILCCYYSHFLKYFCGLLKQSFLKGVEVMPHKPEIITAWEGGIQNGWWCEPSALMWTGPLQQKIVPGMVDLFVFW